MVVRALAIVIAGLCVVVPAARAQPSADQLRTDGEQLAKDGRFTEAITAFKASNKLHVRATNYCLIGLAYTRRELWSQAEIMIDLCKKNATAEDPLPDWLPALEQTLAERLASADVAPIELVVEPAGVKVQLSVSSFAPDELFEPRTIHLAPGRHVVVATANGYNDAQRTIEIGDKQPQRIVITMLPQVPKSTRPTEPARSTENHNFPLIVIGTGAAIVVAGAIYHATLFRTAANELADATDSTPDPALWDQWQHRFDVRRDATIALYAAGVVTVGIGLVLKYTVYKHADSEVRISAAPTSGGGVVSLGWTR